MRSSALARHIARTKTALRPVAKANPKVTQPIVDQTVLSTATSLAGIPVKK